MSGHSFTVSILSGGGCNVLCGSPVVLETGETPAPGGAGLGGGWSVHGDTVAAVG